MERLKRWRDNICPTDICSVPWLMYASSGKHCKHCKHCYRCKHCKLWQTMQALQALLPLHALNHYKHFNNYKHCIMAINFNDPNTIYANRGLVFIGSKNKKGVLIHLDDGHLCLLSHPARGRSEPVV